MYRTTNILLIILLHIIVNGCKSSTKYDFKKVRWGDNQDTVIKSEEIKPSNVSPGMVLYDNASIGKYSCKLAYIFENDSLQTAQYTVSHKTNIKDGDGLSVFVDLRSLLVEKYGNPDKEETEKNGSTYAEWHFKKTKVWLRMEILNSEFINPESLISLVYYDVNTLEKEEKEEQNRELEEKQRTLKSL